MKFVTGSVVCSCGYFVLAACSPHSTQAPPTAPSQEQQALSAYQRDGVLDCDQRFHMDAARGVSLEKREEDRNGCYWDALTL